MQADIERLNQEVENLKNNQNSTKDIMDMIYPVGSISLSAPLNGVNGIVWGGLGNTYDVNPWTYRRTA
ncbi:hypothetical protein D3C72_2249990 [compost metagenome]